MTILYKLESRLRQHLNFIYKDICDDQERENLLFKLTEIMRLDQQSDSPDPYRNNWSEEDVVLITYGNSIVSEEETPLKALHLFLEEFCKEQINSVHILPFFPYSSDDGFSVIDYFSVNPELGIWQDIQRIGGDYRLMADLVINHCSAESEWFANFKRGTGYGHDFFYTVEADDDISMVVRPRTSPLLQKVETAEATKHVWCTFSFDQVDLDFQNPEVLLEIARIIRFYMDRGVRLFRLDAVAFLWKQPGTTCINLPQTHELVRLFRALIEHAEQDAVVITETNIPVRENLSYFGDTNEANWVYNFPLPPLLINTLLTGKCDHLRRWLMSMPPAYDGTAYFNFIASHDGIGLRPVEGILTETETSRLAATIEQFGGKVSWRSVSESEQQPYELNIALYDALQGTIKGADQFNQSRFICAHAIMFGLEGIPGIYIHSLVGSHNNYAGFNQTGQNRSLNRSSWDMEELIIKLVNPETHHHHVINALTSLLEIRKKQPAFHPNATQFTLQLRSELLGFWRQSLNRRQSIFCISNVTDTMQDLTLSTINLIDNQQWQDLISGREIDTSIPIMTLHPYQTVWITNQPSKK